MLQFDSVENARVVNITLLSSDPGSSVRRHKNDATLKDVLDDVSRRLATGELSNQPEVKAELQRIIGETYQGIGLADLAKQNLTAALETQIRMYGEDYLETLKTRLVLANVWVNAGEPTKADTFYRRYLPAVRIAQQKGRLEADYLINAVYNIALLRRADGDSREAETRLREVFSLLPQASVNLRSGHRFYSSVLALTLADQGKFDEATQILRDNVATLRQEQNGDIVNGPELCANLSTLGNALLGKGDYVKAEENLREAESIYRKVFDSTNMQLGDCLRSEAQSLYYLHKYPEAEAKIDECLKIYRKWTNPHDINFATAIMIQGMIYSQTNRVVEAEKLLREAVQIRAQNTTENHFLRATADGELGEFLTRQGRFDEAEPSLLHGYQALKKSQSPNSPRLRTALERLVALYDRWGKPQIANQYRDKLSDPKF